MGKYLNMAKKLNMINAKEISSAQIYFDIRTMLKCRWGCEYSVDGRNIKCHERDTTYNERVEMIKKYKQIILLHCNDARQLSIAAHEIKRAAFLDGYYFAFAIRACALCKTCKLPEGDCPTPQKIRPCDQMFGIDVFKTVRSLDLHIEVLQNTNDIQNRFGFVLIN